MLQNDHSLYKDFKERFCKFSHINHYYSLEELKRKRSEDIRKKNRSKLNRSLTSSMESLSQEFEEPESIIDRNINLMAHFKAYFLMKLKHMSDLTQQQIVRAKTLRDKYET